MPSRRGPIGPTIRLSEAKVHLLAVPRGEAPSQRPDGDLRRAVEIGFYIRDRWAKEEAVRTQLAGLSDRKLRTSIEDAIDTCEPTHFDRLRAEALTQLEAYVDRNRGVIRQGDLVKAAQEFSASMVKSMKIPLWRGIGVWALGVVFGAPLGILSVIVIFALSSRFPEATRADAVDGIFKLMGVRVVVERPVEPSLKGR